MGKALIPLSTQVEIVDKDGKPTPQFCRVLQKLSVGTSLTQTASGTLDLATIAAKTIFANKTAGSASPTACTISEILDFLGSVAQGDIIYRNASAWVRLPAGTAGQVLTTGGPGANPSWTTPSGGGGGGGTPVVRASNIQSSSSASYTVTWPTGTVAGDVVIVFGGHGFNFVSPTNWIVLDNNQGSNFNGITIAKVMTAADITAGSLTLTTAGGFNGVVSAVTIIGTGMTGIRMPASFVRSSSGPSAATATPLQSLTPNSTDLILAFAGSRVAGTFTFSAGMTSLQAINAASASGALGKFTGTLSSLGLNETFQSSVAGSGYYTSIVCLR